MISLISIAVFIVCMFNITKHWLFILVAVLALLKVTLDTVLLIRSIRRTGDIPWLPRKAKVGYIVCTVVYVLSSLCLIFTQYVPISRFNTNVQRIEELERCSDLVFTKKEACAAAMTVMPSYFVEPIDLAIDTLNLAIEVQETLVDLKNNPDIEETEVVRITSDLLANKPMLEQSIVTAKNKIYFVLVLLLLMNLSPGIADALRIRSRREILKKLAEETEG